jgi:hypothetical protein
MKTRAKNLKAGDQVRGTFADSDEVLLLEEVWESEHEICALTSVWVKDRKIDENLLVAFPKESPLALIDFSKESSSSPIEDRL